MKQIQGKRNLLLVDDEPEQHRILGGYLSQRGFAVQNAPDAISAISMVRTSPPDMIIMDVRMPGMTGLEALAEIRKVEPKIPILLITAFTDIREAVRAMKDGAVDYLAKPVDLNELSTAICDALGTIAPPSERVDVPPLPTGVVVASPAVRDVIEQIALVAPSDATVVFTGESGTGKEVFTEILHQWSPRRGYSLVKVNCAAIPDELLESELFGYEPGAFTGAVKTKPGRFEAAHEGSLFLDEIAEISGPLQAKLLRAIEDRTVMRLGSNNAKTVDFRLVAATNKDLEEEVQSGRFREDLFYRLSVITIHIPPLRERRQDIPVLSSHFSHHFAQDKVRVSPLALHCLETYGWPGNVRELRNEIERACLMCRGNVILPEHLSPRIARSVPHSQRVSEGDPVGGSTLAEMEKAAILHTLGECKGNRTQTAKKLGISRRALIYKLKNYESQEEPPSQVE